MTITPTHSASDRVPEAWFPQFCEFFAVACLSRGEARYAENVVDGDEAHLALPAAPKAAGLARAFVRAQLATADAAEALDAVSLCVSELVTNALDHAAPPFELRVACAEDRLRVEVSDATTARPIPREVEPTALRGRGLQFVEQSATRWGVDPNPHGKTVWAEFGLRSH